MDVPWKVIFAFVGVFIAGAIFGGVFTIGVSARRAPGGPRQAAAADRPLAQLPPASQPKSQVAGPAAPASNPNAGMVAAPAWRSNPITPQLMNQFTRRLPALTAEQKDSLRRILGRAGEDFHRLRQENLADVARVTERMYADVASVLTLEQRAELETMRKQLEERIQNERRKREAAAAEAANKVNAKEQPARSKDSTPGPE